MDNSQLFSVALGLSEPWYVKEVHFIETESADKKELHIDIAFRKGSKFSCSMNGCSYSDLSVHDTREKIWRHMNFFEHRCYIHARVPRVNCPDHSVHMVELPWARSGSGFTLLMEAYLLELASVLSVRAIAELVGTTDTKIWRVISHYVTQARKRQDFSTVRKLGVDEYSHRGQNYLTIFIDHNQGEPRVIGCENGRSMATITQFTKHFTKQQGDPERIRVVTCDMAAGYASAVTTSFPNAKMVIDKFHVISNANAVVDDVRRRETRQNHILKKTRYIWLKNKDHLTENQVKLFKKINKMNLKTVKAYQMRIALQDMYQASTREEAELSMDELCSWIMHSNIVEMKRIARMLRKHKTAILNYFDYRITNAALEGLNSVIALVKRRARGFRNMEYFKTMIYLACGKLALDPTSIVQLPTRFSE